MKKSALETAQELLKRRNFSKAITVLEGASENYRESFDYYLTAGTACLYLGDYGNANSYFNQARKIRMTETNLLLGQAVLYLRRGDTDRSLQYYLDILDNDPENKIAIKAMEFIRTQGNYETICNWVDSGRIQQFYPPLGVNPSKIMRIVFSAVAGVCIGLCLIYLLRPQQFSDSGKRADLSALVLSADEMKNPQEKDLSGGVYHYIMSDKEIRAAYDDARQYFQDSRDNAARVEVNRILNSNAAVSLRQKANLLQTYFEDPTFDTLTDNYTYAQVASDPILYLGCWVAWSGRITNAVAEDGSYRCDLLVGYEDLQRVDGIVPLFFSVAPVPEIDGSRSVRVLAKIGMENGNLALLGRSVYQPLQKSGD
ncbi:MAG: hypothetical protein IJP62_11110 [Treponema sp.]|nr:hypothetical protein [Treponema sp.]